MELHLILKFLSLFILYGLTQAQTLNYEWINPSPTGFTLSSISFSTPKNGVIVGEAGTILHSSDAGLTWKAAYSGTIQSLNSIAFADPLVGVAVGDGILLRTTDGGENWKQIQLSGSQHKFTCIAFSGANVGVTVGDSVLLQTFDGGLTWSEDSDAHQNSGYVAIAFSADGFGLAIWSHGFLMQTNGSSRTWTEPTTFKPISNNIKLAFDNAGDAYLVDGGLGVYKVYSPGLGIGSTGFPNGYYTESNGLNAIAFYHGKF